MLEKDVVVFALTNPKLDLLTFTQLMYELKYKMFIYASKFTYIYLNSFKLVMETMMSMKLKELLNVGKLLIV
jgi:hypothetical protein